MATTLTHGVVAAAQKQDNAPEEATIKLTALSKMPTGGAYRCTVTDGSGARMAGLLVAACKKGLADGSLQLNDGAVVHTKASVFNELQGEPTMLISSLELRQQGSGPALSSTDDAAGAKADQGTPASGAAKQQPRTPLQPTQINGAAAVALGLTPGPTPSPSQEPRSGSHQTPAAQHSGAARMGGVTPQPPSASPLAVRDRGSAVQPIAALNPYATNWCIKAKLVSKGPVRTFTGRGGATNRVFNCELADAMGTHIQATFWREAAEKFADSMQEGKVYYFSTFQVKPANKAYATVRNDYELHCDGRTEVEEAADQSGISAAQAVEVVPLPELPKYAGKRTTVDVLGVVLEVQPVTTVKRRSDSSELRRRDVTLADSSCRSVVLTLWGDAMACDEQLETCKGRILQVARVRVSDYNGCSLSTISRSEVTFDPDSEEAAALRSWWEGEGCSAAITPVAEGTAGGAGGAGGAAGGSGRSKLEFLSDFTAGELPPPEAKPTYHDVVVSVTQVLDERTMWYLADPDTKRKVERREDGRFWCEGTGSYVDAASNRYTLRVRIADATDETFVALWDETGTQLMGCSADEACALRDSNPAAFAELVRSRAWNEWGMRLSARCKEYNGNRRMEYTCMRLEALDPAREGHQLLQLMQQQASRK